MNKSIQIAEYTYNGAGQRIKKITQSDTRIFHYDLRGHLITETNQTGQILAEYIYLGDQLLSMIKPGEAVYYFHNDHLGTPQVLTDDTQAIAWKGTYTPFGRAVISIQSVENPFRFPGQYYDPETGLHYNYFRYYNPQTGRYITPDPIGLEGGINLFFFVAGNPTNWIDPLGLCRKSGESYYNCLDRRAKETLGLWVVLSDELGYYGLGSLAVGVGLDLYASFSEKLAEEGIKNAELAGAFKKGNIVEKIAAAEEGAKTAVRTKALRSTLRVVTKVSGAIGVCATGFSVFSRAAFIKDCSEECTDCK